MPTLVEWVGGAQPISQIDEYEFGGTWAEGDTVDVACNDKHCIVTLGTGASTDPEDIANEVASSINAGSYNNPAVTTGFTRSVGGQEITEFLEVTASTTDAFLYLKSTAGVPVTFTVTKTSTSGTITATAIQDATGPEFVDNELNYAGGSLPSADEYILLDDSKWSMLYGLDYFRTYSITFGLIRTANSQSNIGLNQIRDVSGKTYTEYRPQRLQLYNNDATLDVMFKSGQLGADNAGYALLDAVGQTYGRLHVEPLAASNAYAKRIEVVGGEFATGINLQCGNVRLDVDGENYGAAMEAGYFILGSVGDNSNLLTVLIGPTFDFTSCSYIKLRNGRSESRSVYANKVTDANDFVITGGEHYYECSSAVATRNVIIEAGKLVVLNDINILQVHVYSNGTFDVERAVPNLTIAAIYLSQGATLNNSSGAVVGAELITVGCGIQSTKATMPANLSYTVAFASSISPA